MCANWYSTCKRHIPRIWTRIIRFAMKWHRCSPWDWAKCMRWWWKYISCEKKLIRFRFHYFLKRGVRLLAPQISFLNLMTWQQLYIYKERNNSLIKFFDQSIIAQRFFIHLIGSRCILQYTFMRCWYIWTWKMHCSLLSVSQRNPLALVLHSCTSRTLWWLCHKVHWCNICSAGCAPAKCRHCSISTGPVRGHSQGVLGV